ncbi:MAG: hypothetical protein LBG59_06980 [Candidatus Peribacteria bacterium]|nr:hypothetical protein [Candidatus Peribacteria bacterium]
MKTTQTGKNNNTYIYIQSSDARVQDFNAVFSAFTKIKEEDLEDLERYKKDFEQLVKTYGRFSLEFKESGFMGKIFEIVGKNGPSFIVKIPHQDLWTNNVNVEKMTQQEISYQQQFIQYHQTLQAKYAGMDKEWLVNNIAIPFVHQATDNRERPLIIMEKLSGETVWYYTVAAIFSPIFTNERFLERIETHHPTVQEIDTTLLSLVGKVSVSDMFNAGMLENYPTLSVEEILQEVSETALQPNLFLQIFPENQPKGKKLYETYKFFLEEFGNVGLFHPDNHLRNFMITNDDKLGIIDF